MTALSRPKTPRLHGGRAELDLITRRLNLLAAHLGVDLDELERAAGADVRSDVPASWESMAAAGLNPLTGEASP
jgi:hypothetical protein